MLTSQGFCKLTAYPKSGGQLQVAQLQYTKCTKVHYARQRQHVVYMSAFIHSTSEFVIMFLYCRTIKHKSQGTMDKCVSLSFRFLSYGVVLDN